MFNVHGQHLLQSFVMKKKFCSGYMVHSGGYKKNHLGIFPPSDLYHNQVTNALNTKEKPK